MSGDTTTFPTQPCIILVCPIQSWRSGNAAWSYMIIKTSPSFDRAGDGNSEGGWGDPTGSPTSRPKGISIPPTGTPGFSGTGGDSGESSATSAQIISSCWYSILQEEMFSSWSYEHLLLSRLLFSMILWYLLLRLFNSYLTPSSFNGSFEFFAYLKQTPTLTARHLFLRQSDSKTVETETGTRSV